MKKYLIALLAPAVFVGFTGCADDEPRHTSTTTTTEETHVRQPVTQTTTETRERAVY